MRGWFVKGVRRRTPVLVVAALVATGISVPLESALSGVAAAAPAPPVPARRAPLAPKAAPKPKPSTKPADPMLDSRRKPALANQSASTPRALATDAADAAAAGSGLSRIGVGPDLNCSADMDSYPTHPGVFYGDTACATVLVVNGATYGPAYIPAGPAPDVVWTPISQSSSGSGVAGDPLVITTTVAAGDSGVTLTETDTFVTGSLEWLTSVSVSVPAGVVVSRLTRGQDCYVAASDYGIGQGQSTTGTSFCEGRTAALGLRPTTQGATWYETHYSTVWSAVFGAGDLPNTYDPDYLDNGQAVSWALPGTAGTFVRSWRTVVVLGTTAQEQGGAPNEALHGTTCSTSSPVNCATGDFWHTFTDVTVPARGLPLAFRRTYDLATSAAAGRLGWGWHDSFDLSVRVAGSQAVVWQENGAKVAFDSNGSGGWTADTRVLARLTTEPGGGWRFRRISDDYAFVFSAAGRLTSVVADDGESLTLAYDANGHLTSVSHSGAGQIAIGWTGDRITSVTDPAGRRSTFAYGASGDLTGTTGPDGAAWQLGYDGAHHLLSMTDPLGRVTANTFDAQLRVTKQVQPDGRSITWAYEGDPATPAGGITTMTDERGSVTRYEYQSMLQLSRTIAVGTPAEATTRFDYDLLTLGLVGRTDPLGRKISFEYDILGRLIASTDALGETTRFSYDGTSSRRTSTMLPSGRTATSTYDSSGRVVSSRDAGGTETTYAYGDPSHPGDLTSTTTAGRTHRFSYDALGTVVRETVAQTVLFDSTTDASGRPLCRVGGTQYAAGTRCTTGTPPGTTTYGYDAAGRQLRVTDQMGRTATVQYDLVGNRTAITAAAGTRTTFAYDGLDRVTAMTEAAGTTKSRTTTTRYDVPAGQGGCPSDIPDAATCLITSDGGRRTTVQVDDAAATTIAAIRPGGGRTRYQHDQAGQVTSSEDSSGRTINYGYDSAGRVVDMNYSDFTTPPVSYRYDVDGRRVQMDDGIGRTLYEYDDAGRLTAQTTPAGTVRASYNALGEGTSLVYPDGSAVTRSYDGLGRLASTTDWAGRTTGFGYDEDGHTLTTAYPNGRTVTSAYDVSGAPVRQSVDGSTPLSIAWTRDALGRVGKETTQGLAGPATTDIGYDPLGQLSAFGTTTVMADASGSPAVLGTAQQSFTPGLSLAGRADGPRTSTFGTSGTGARASVAGGNGATATLGYDQADRLTSFAAIDGPDVKQLSSTSGTSSGGQTITITGSGFAPGAVVRFGTTASSKVVVASPTSLTAVVPAGSGAVDVRVTTAVGTSAIVPAGRWTYLRPTVTGLSPARGPAVGGQTVLINGWNLTGATAVRFGIKTASFTVVSAQQIRAVAPSGTAGVAAVTVTTPQGTSSAATATQYTYVAVPVVTAVSPGIATRRGGTTITVAGMNFTGATLVRFGSTRATSLRVVSASSLTAVAPAGTGAVHLTVTTRFGTSAATSADVVSYAAGPGVLRLSPTSVRSTGAVKVTVTGFGFTTSSVVLVGGKSVSRTYSSTTALVATVPAGSGVVHVQVRNGTTTSPAWNGDRLTYLAPAVTKLSASTGPLAGGQRITVTGTRLTGATAVRFGTTFGTNVVVSSSTSLSVTVPPGIAGAVDVRVTTPEGTSPVVTSDKWTYTNLPLVTGVNRRILAAQGGQTLTVTGSNLADATELVVGSTHVPVDDATSGTATVTAPHGTGTVPVRVVSSYGTSTTSASVTYTTLDERYHHNGDGLRVETTSADGTLKQTMWDPFGTVPRPLVDGERRFVYGGDGLPLEQVDADGTTTYFVHDQLGSTRALLGSSGEVAATFGYGPFGQLTARTGTATTPILFAGGYQDPTGLIYLINRNLDPVSGVFLTVDPALQLTGQPYSYGSGDPVNSVDPMGLWPTVVIGAIIGGVVGAASGAVNYAINDHGDAPLWRYMAGGAAGGAISGACMGLGVGLLASSACGAAAGTLQDSISRWRVDENTISAYALGAVGGAVGRGALGEVGPEIRSSWLSLVNRSNGGLRPSTVWHPGNLAWRMYRSTFWGTAIDFDLNPLHDWLGSKIRCGLEMVASAMDH